MLYMRNFSHLLFARQSKSKTLPFAHIIAVVQKDEGPKHNYDGGDGYEYEHYQWNLAHYV